MTRLKQAWQIAMAALREIFDEASYARFLQRTQLDSSAEAYAAFWREREAKPPKPRCC